MPSLESKRMLRQGDRLLRKLNAGTWDRKTLEVYPEAFQDQYANLSLFVERIMAPRDVLKFFARIAGFRAGLFGNTDSRTPEDLWNKGIGIGVVTFEAVTTLGLRFKVGDDGFPMNQKGRVNVIDGKKMMLELSRLAVALSYSEIFPSVTPPSR
jgi:hypothetical protein